MMKRLGLITMCVLASAMLVACGDDAPTMVDGGIVLPDAMPDSSDDAAAMDDADRPDAPPPTDMCEGLGDSCRPERGCRTGECQAERTVTVGEGPDSIQGAPAGSMTSYAVTIDPEGYCTHAYGPDACNPNDPDDTTCGPCGSCEYIGQASTGERYYSCFRTCERSVTDNGVCRDGYACSIGGGICNGGCESDFGCRISREDTNMDGDVDDGPNNSGVDRLTYDTASDAVCNPATFRCEHTGRMEARAGDRCERDSDCEANGRCISDARYGWPGGYCVKDGCDVPGNECAGLGDGVVCQERGIGAPFCLMGCEFGSGWTPDDASTPMVDESDVDGDGSHFDDYVSAAAFGGGCDTGYSCIWNGTSGPGVAGSGGCSPASGTSAVEVPNVGLDCSAAFTRYQTACSDTNTACVAACAGDTTCAMACATDLAACEAAVTSGSDLCYSPLGQGYCSGLGDDGYCIVRDCNVDGAPADMCGTGNVCVTFGRAPDTNNYCLQGCTAPDDCGSPELGCVQVTMGGSKVCYPGCEANADCQTGSRCDVPVGSTFGECVPAA
jgi:hypothetical protein